MFRYVTVDFNNAESIDKAEKRKAMLESKGWTLVHTASNGEGALLSYSDKPKLVDTVNESA